MERPYESFEHVLLFGGGEYADETMGRLNETYKYLADDNDQLKKEMVKAYQKEDFDSEKHAELQSRFHLSCIALAKIIEAKQMVFDYGVKKIKKEAELEKETPEQPSQVYTIDLGSLKKYSKILFTTDKATYDQWINNQRYDILINDKMIGEINVYLAGILPGK